MIKNDRDIVFLVRLVYFFGCFSVMFYLNKQLLFQPPKNNFQAFSSLYFFIHAQLLLKITPKVYFALRLTLNLMLTFATDKRNYKFNFPKVIYLPQKSFPPRKYPHSLSSSWNSLKSSYTECDFIPYADFFSKKRVLSATSFSTTVKGCKPLFEGGETNTCTFFQIFYASFQCFF